MEPLSETWTDYDGAAPYADYTVEQGSPTEVMAYLPGVWQMPAGGGAEQLHGDQIGTTRLMIDASTPHPQITRQAVYTAFGERVWTASGSTATRYGYAGAHSYEEKLLPKPYGSPDFGFVHVGARWYDPATGRFLERDPIGVGASINLYEYVRSTPTASIDPNGLWPRGAMEMHYVYRGLREQGMSPSQASQTMADNAGFEAAAGAAWAGAFLCVEGGATLLRFRGPEFGPFAGRMAGAWHFHLGGKELGRWHLPHQARAWCGNAVSIVKRWFR
jgi:RHS repeat-associated protein